MSSASCRRSPTFARELVAIGLVELGRLDLALRLAGACDQVLDAGADLLDLVVGELDGVDDTVLP